MPIPFHPMFLNDLGHAWRVEGEECAGEIEVIDELCVPGTRTMRVSVLAALADIMAGAASNVAIAPRIPLTVDLTVHSLHPPFVRNSGTTLGLTMLARPVKAGRSTTVVEVVFRADDGSAVVISHVTHMASPRPDDVMAEVHWSRPAAPPKVTMPIFDQIAARVIEPGVVELDRVPYVMQPSGTVMGGAVAMIAELAAETVAEAPVTDLDVRYLSTVRVGPARASATVLGARLVRVEIRDPGNDDRLATLVIARTG